MNDSERLDALVQLVDAMLAQVIKLAEMAAETDRKGARTTDALLVLMQHLGQRSQIGMAEVLAVKQALAQQPPDLEQSQREQAQIELARLLARLKSPPGSS